LLSGAFCALQIVCALGILVLQGPLAPRFAGWSVSDAFLASALPAGIYAVQNVLVQGAYPHLDSLTLTMLNQTKLLFTALFTALILGSARRPPLSTPHLRPPVDQAVCLAVGPLHAPGWGPLCRAAHCISLTSDSQVACWACAGSFLCLLVVFPAVP
jgi:UDP-sugar transporter A1/2/3